MKITDTDRLDFIEKYHASINHRGGSTANMIKWSIHSYWQKNYGETVREAIDDAIKKMESRGE